MRSDPWCVHAVPTLACVVCLSGSALRAEDADRLRPYLAVHYGEMATPWGVHDHFGVALGANLDNHWGIELNSDVFQVFPKDTRGLTFGEESMTTLMPQVRYRVALARNWLVPYVIGGVGPVFAGFHDRKQPGFGRAIELDDTVVGIATGGGLDFFVSDGVAVNIEAKYLWSEPVSGSMDGAPVEFNFSKFLLSAGLRVYWDPNNPALGGEPVERPGHRYHLSGRFGGAAMTDGQWTDSASLTHAASAFPGGLAHSGGLSFGMIWGDHFGVDLAADIWEPNLHHAGYGTIGEYALRTVVPEFTLRFPVAGGRWVPSLSAGIGIAHAEFNDRKPPGDGLRVEASGFHPATRVSGEIEYFVNRNLSLGFGLHWVRTWGHTLSIDDGPAESGAMAALQAQVGFRVYFPSIPAR